MVLLASCLRRLTHATAIESDETGCPWTPDDVRDACDTLPRAAKAPRKAATP
jgi:hypothetical protein